MAAEYTALIVDDEAVIRKGYSRILSSEGFRVLTAANGKEALDLIASQPVDVVLCDLKMPVMGALEVLNETRQRYPDLPVIIITGHGTVECIVECMQKGAYYFLSKPITAEHLLMMTRKALEK